MKRTIPDYIHYRGPYFADFFYLTQDSSPIQRGPEKVPCVDRPDLLLILHTDDSEEEKGFVAEYREAPRGRIRPKVQMPRPVPNKEPIS
ncbi:hypothetical protein COOONC_18465 [Cooperia oncophora]